MNRTVGQKENERADLIVLSDLHLGEGLMADEPRYVPTEDFFHDLQFAHFLEALAEAMPEGVQWTSPEGGYCAWVTLPERGDFDPLYRVALSRGVAYTPGEVFLAAPDRRKHLRLCFSSQDESGIEAAVLILGEIISDLAGRQSMPSSRLRVPKPIV